MRRRGDNGAIYTSTNGATWQKQNSGVNTWFRGAAAGAGDFGSSAKTAASLTSPNGTSWTTGTSARASIGIAFISPTDASPLSARAA